MKIRNISKFQKNVMYEVIEDSLSRDLIKGTHIWVDDELKLHIYESHGYMNPCKVLYSTVYSAEFEIAEGYTIP